MSIVRSSPPRWPSVPSSLRSPGGLLALGFVALVVIAVIVPQLFSPYDPFEGVTADRLQPPSLDHLFGTDHLGRDLFTRVVHGTRLSLAATVVAVVVGGSVGGLLGLLAGFLGGLVDHLVMRLADVLLAVPALLLSLALVTALGHGTIKVAIAVGVASIASFARVMRAEVLRVRTTDYVEASRLLGARHRWVLRRHVLPNAMSPVLALATLEFGVAILSVAALSFLGYGALPPTPEWGTLISDGRDYLATSWWLTTLPGLVVIATVLSVNRLAQAFDRGVQP